MELDRKMGSGVSVVMRVASFTALPARPLPGIDKWPGIDWIKIEDEIELMELRMANVQGCDDMRSSHQDLLSLQKRTVNE